MALHKNSYIPLHHLSRLLRKTAFEYRKEIIPFLTHYHIIKYKVVPIQVSCAREISKQNICRDFSSPF